MSKTAQQSPHTSTTQFVTRQWLIQRWGISQATIIRMEQRGEITPVFLGARLVRYRLEDIEAREAEGSKQPATAK